MIGSTTRRFVDEQYSTEIEQRDRIALAVLIENTYQVSDFVSNNFSHGELDLIIGGKLLYPSFANAIRPVRWLEKFVIFDFV